MIKDRTAFDKLGKLEKKISDKKDKLKERLYASPSSNHQKCDVFFPRYHLSEKNIQLLSVKGWFYNGFIIRLPKLTMLVDPGIDITYRLDLSRISIPGINTLFVSHAHIDHVGGVNNVMDWLISRNEPTQIITTSEVIRNKEISAYHAGLLNDSLSWKAHHFTTQIEKDKDIELVNGGYVLTPITMHHGIECFGFRMVTDFGSIAYISDTGYAKKIKTDEGIIDVGQQDIRETNLEIIEQFEHLKNDVQAADILIINVETFRYKKKSKTHLTLFDVIDIVKDNAIGKIILTHLNPVGTLQHEYAVQFKNLISKDTGVPTYLPGIEGLSLEIR